MNPPEGPRRKKIALHNLIMIGLVAGVVAGILIRKVVDEGTVTILADGIAYPIGQVFLRMLFLVVVPLVFASITLGVAGLGDLRRVGGMGARALLFFLVMSALSAMLGLTAMNVLQPGTGFDPAIRESLMDAYGGDAATIKATAAANQPATLLARMGMYLDMFLPRNMLQAVVVNMQMIPLIVFALLFGAALTFMPEDRRRVMTGWLESLNDAMIGIVGIAMKLAPLAVFCLIFSVVARFGLDVVNKLAFYVLTILGCYVIQLFVVYPILLAVLARRRPFQFLKKAIPIMVTAFSTSSSSATLPTSIRVSEKDLGIRKTIGGFVLPLGATMNMNGTALFEGALILFVAQIFGIEFTLEKQLLVIMLAVFTAIGAAGVPGGALPLIMVVMAQVGVPPDGIAIVLGADRILDMGRTVVNVTGDVVCAAWIERTQAGSTVTPSPGAS